MDVREVLGLSNLADVLDNMLTCMLHSMGSDGIHIYMDHTLAYDLVTLWTPGSRMSTLLKGILSIVHFHRLKCYLKM